MTADHNPHFIIIGAGITGLILAQGLKKQGVSFEIFERDPNAEFRGAGWGLTIHWALDEFLALIPDHLKDRLEETYVNPVAVKNDEAGNFLFYDLQSGEARWQVPAAKRIRVSRERLRKLLMDGLDIQWNKTFASAQDAGADGITAHFEDGTTVTGSCIVGCDGAQSKVRQWLCPSLAKPNVLPYKMLGVTVPYTRALAQSMRDLDPYFMQGGDPKHDSFFYFSFLECPKNDTPSDDDIFRCQIIVSWPYRAGYLGSETPIEVPVETEDRIALLKKISNTWADPFKSILQNIPETTSSKSITIVEWIPNTGVWDNRKGKITLIGDAAHTMTMFRGEAANQGIADVTRFMAQYKPSWDSAAAKPFDAAVACNEYEAEMIERNNRAVRASTRACQDAHHYATIDGSSPLVNKRVIDVEQ
ncbi:Hypothetical protein R9X50_00284600 [Acrodontium crateriforme]|uniref:FAD-binding domain-containing protein n=1 Tax=Acrodontium crateriforme TaxID=150365 RepID=A0AAQ3M4N9_9PEZI|nr:Hypothetical protein R9X50_00284600 [Acrodontium crateriforme]